MTYIKRAIDDFRSASTPPSPKKKKKPEAESAIRVAISSTGEGPSRGLMKYFRPCMKDEHDAQVQRFTEEHHASMEEERTKERKSKAFREEKSREVERLRQQKHRRLKREGEIARGERTPGGTKRKHSVVDLKESPTKKAKHSMAELSRPGWAEKEIARNKNKRSSGRKRIHEQTDAKYMNWHTLFLCNQIVDAAKHPSVGYSMSASRIRDILATKDPKTFGNISRTTIDGWIDRSGLKPRWSESALLMAENGNRPGGQGGRTGVLVRKLNSFNQSRTTDYNPMIRNITR
jgi:hypothetical protein